MQTLDSEKQGCSLQYLGSSETIFVSDQKIAEESADNPYMLDAINEIDEIFTVYGGATRIASFKGLSSKVNSESGKSVFKRNHKQEEETAKMVRISGCHNLVATVYTSKIYIQKSGVFLNDQRRKLDLFDEKLKEETVFTLSEGEYFYLEWPPLNRAFLDRPTFLTLDTEGGLRVHYINEKTEQVIDSRETFLSATFSLGGKFIYAINTKQEICKIDVADFRIVLRRKIEGLSVPQKILSSHIQQLTPRIFAIGSVMKADDGTNLKPCLHLVYGNISDQEEELKMKAFEMPLLEEFDSKKPVVFRTLYVKERQLLLFGHTGSNKVRVLQFGLDGSETELEGLSLGLRTLRGMVFMKEKKPRELKNEYQNKEIELSNGPQFVILDSLGCVHHFRYFDPNSCAPTLSLFIHPYTIKFFVEVRGRREMFGRKKKSRWESQDAKIKLSPIAQNKKRSESLIPMEYSPIGTKLSHYEKQKMIKPLKENLPKVPLSQSKQPENSLFKVAENPFLSMKKTEDKPEESKTMINNLFSSKKEDKPNTSGLFSVKTEESKTTTNSLFSSKKEDKLTTTATSSLFSSKTESKPATSGLFSATLSSTKPTENSLFSFSAKPSQKAEPQNSLFGSAPKKQPESEINNLFSGKSQSRAFEAVPDDPTKKKAMLFLNKLESDVTFKVEDQEFPAHKAILSEKCRFFKNMFSSGMSESHAAVIEIFETKASMFKAFLQYVYFGQAILNEELAMSLFGFAEKYMIDELKENCENLLATLLTLKNCFKIYDTANYYEADSLKKKTLRFFKAHMEEIMESKEFEDIPKSTYIALKRIQWNEEIIFDPSFAELMKNAMNNKHF